MTFSEILFYAAFKLQTMLNLNSLGVIEWYRIQELNADVGMPVLTDCTVQILEKKK